MLTRIEYLNIIKGKKGVIYMRTNNIDFIGNKIIVSLSDRMEADFNRALEYRNESAEEVILKIVKDYISSVFKDIASDYDEDNESGNGSKQHNVKTLKDLLGDGAQPEPNNMTMGFITNPLTNGINHPYASKIERWAKKPNQINSIIIREFLKLAKGDRSISYDELFDHFDSNEKMLITIQQFTNNFAQMKTAKIFEESRDHIVRLNPDIEDFVIEKFSWQLQDDNL